MYPDSRCKINDNWAIADSKHSKLDKHNNDFRDDIYSVLFIITTSNDLCQLYQFNYRLNKKWVKKSEICTADHPSWL